MNETIRTTEHELAVKYNPLLIPGEIFSTYEECFLRLIIEMYLLSPRGYVDYIVLFHKVYGWKFGYALEFIRKCRPMGLLSTTHQFDWEEFGKSDKLEIETLLRCICLRTRIKFETFYFNLAIEKFEKYLAQRKHG